MLRHRQKGKWFQLAEKQPLLAKKKEKILVEKTSGEIFFNLSLRGKYLNYTILPEKPETIKKAKILALTTSKPSWKPPADHSWRKPFIFNPEKRYQISSQV